ncbi:MAG: DEAD/DEAH box helicase family protein [Deltaproteobacteria bacterium]|nr:DEAD/DEAH box helicase family protein [Deltaproteobacteria bacterium]
MFVSHAPKMLFLSPPREASGSTLHKSPRPHQADAVQDIVATLSRRGEDLRTQCIMACGTGKTLVGYWAADKLGQRTLLCEPTLNLIRQNLIEWKGAEKRRSGTEYLVVCSDETTVRINQDESIVRPEDLPARVTNDPREIRAFLADTSTPKRLLSTYHSLPLVAQAMKSPKVPRFDCSVADEAHRTATREESVFGLIHDPRAIKSRTRLYLTATPKVFIGDAESVYSMDDERTYGKVSHRLPFSKAIERGLLTDYQVVVGAISEREMAQLERLGINDRELKAAVAELAFLRAAEKYHLSKVLTFHSSVRKAHDLADRIEYSAKAFIPKRPVWVHAVDGKMPTATRSHLLTLLGEQPSRTLSVISNCRCLTEGVDVPAIDGVVFFEPRKDEIDIVQAVGRAMRNAPDKKIGTILIPVVIPEGADAETVLARSEYRKVAQVLRALRAHDDRVEAYCRAKLSKGKGKSGGCPGDYPEIHIDIGSLPEFVRKSLTTKVISTGVRGTLLTEEGIIKAAREFYRKYGSLPTQRTKEEVPGMPGESWISIYVATKEGHRGLQKGRTMTEILTPLAKELGLDNTLTVDLIIEAARNYYQRNNRLPHTASTEKVPEIPGSTWNAIHLAAYLGYRGFEKGGSLFSILEPLRLELGLDRSLSDETIIAAAREFYVLHKKLPSATSKEEVPGRPGDSWKAIDAAASAGTRGLPKGRSLPQILAPLREELGYVRELTEHDVIEAARTFFKKHKHLPTERSVDDVPGMKGVTWRAISEAGKLGNRGLEKGKSLAKLLEPLALELGLSSQLTEAQIIDAARKYFDKYKRLPSQGSKEEVPGMPGMTWRAIDSGGFKGIRGLKKGRTLSKILEPLRNELGLDKNLTEDAIIASARRFHEENGYLPTAATKAEAPGLSTSWIAINSAGKAGRSGLQKGRSLAKILAPLRDELEN